MKKSEEQRKLDGAVSRSTTAVWVFFLAAAVKFNEWTGGYRRLGKRTSSYSAVKPLVKLRQLVTSHIWYQADLASGPYCKRYHTRCTAWLSLCGMANN